MDDDPSRLAPELRACRLALALLLFENLDDPQPITHDPSPIWRGTCSECGRYYLEISNTDDTVTMQCMLCGWQPNWRKLEQDVFIPHWESDPRQLRIDQIRRELLRPNWLWPCRGPEYDRLDDVSKTIWDETRDQIAPELKVWITRLANATKVGLITEIEGGEAVARYDRLTADAGA